MIFLGTLLFVLLIVILYRHKTWSALPWPVEAMQPPKYQGHRGYWIEGEQENTLAAFRAAGRRGLQMVEMDVRLSVDQVPIVFHDEDLKRIGNSPQDKVSTLTAQQMLQKVKAPSLGDVLQDSEVPSFLNIELKTVEFWSGALEKQVAAVVRRHHAEKRVLISSFNPLALWRMSRHLPEVPRALLASKTKEPVNRFYLRHLFLAPYVRIHALHLDHIYVSHKEMADWSRRKVPVSLWTVNDPERAGELLRAGALSIISDRLPLNEESAP